MQESWQIFSRLIFSKKVALGYCNFIHRHICSILFYHTCIYREYKPSHTLYRRAFVKPPFILSQFLCEIPRWSAVFDILPKSCGSICDHKTAWKIPNYMYVIHLHMLVSDTTVQGDSWSIRERDVLLVSTSNHHNQGSTLKERLLSTSVRKFNKLLNDYFGKPFFIFTKTLTLARFIFQA